jgi:hypothetical protein
MNTSRRGFLLHSEKAERTGNISEAVTKEVYEMPGKQKDGGNQGGRQGAQGGQSKGGQQSSQPSGGQRATQR